MEWLTDNVLFYGGIAVAGASVLAAAAAFFILSTKKRTLIKKLAEEYGEKHAKKIDNV